jgi:hypothetical protein
MLPQPHIARRSSAPARRTAFAGGLAGSAIDRGLLRLAKD